MTGHPAATEELNQFAERADVVLENNGKSDDDRIESAQVVQQRVCAKAKIKDANVDVALKQYQRDVPHAEVILFAECDEGNGLGPHAPISIQQAGLVLIAKF